LEENITGVFSPDPIYYVYLHYRNDTDGVFYVGKGKDRRAWSKGSRNKHWKHIVAKCGYTIKIIEDNLTEQEAFEREIYYIEQFGITNLVNMTIGGHTSTGYRHTDASRLLQSNIAKSRKDSNPEWYAAITLRMQKLSESQKQDSNFYKRLGESNSAWYKQLSEEDKLLCIAKKTAWLKDPDKVAKAQEKAIKTRQSDKSKEAARLKTKLWWDNLSQEQRQAENFKRAEAARKAAQYKTGVISTSTTYIVNREVLFPTITKLSEHLGTGITASITKMKQLGLNITLFKGFVIEIYDKELHGDVIGKIELLQPLEHTHWNTKSAVKRSDGKIFLSISEAAESFGVKQTASTADWISRCIKNNLPAMGFEWSRPSFTECEVEIFKRLSKQKENINV
jgi:hypothetical protein